MKTYQVDKNGFYGNFGGAYIPEILHQCVQNLKNAYLKSWKQKSSNRNSLNFSATM